MTRKVEALHILKIEHRLVTNGESIMQWILQDIPLGRNIQTVRMSRNMTQMQVVEKMQLIGSSISRSTYANIETGRRNIKASDLRALREVLNVDYSEFFKD